MATRNKTAGDQWERDCIIAMKDHKIAFVDKKGVPQVPVSSRFESYAEDGRKIDICFTGIDRFQCKNTVDPPAIHQLLRWEMPPGTRNSILWKRTKKYPDGKFRVQAYWAILQHKWLKTFDHKLKFTEKKTTNMPRLDGNTLWRKVEKDRVVGVYVFIELKTYYQLLKDYYGKLPAKD